MSPLAEWRIKAADTMWRTVLEIRANTSSPLTLLDMLDPSEYQSIGTDENLRSTLLDREDLAQLSSDFEQARPFAGEKLFKLVFIYRAVRLRICLLLKEGVGKGLIQPWYEDRLLKEHLSQVLTQDEMKRFEEQNPPLVRGFSDLIESKILAEIQLMLSEVTR